MPPAKNQPLPKALQALQPNYPLYWEVDPTPYVIGVRAQVPGGRLDVWQTDPWTWEVWYVKPEPARPESLGKFSRKINAMRAAEKFARGLAKSNPARFRHERVQSPAALRRRGLTKFRTVRAGSSRVVMAFPPGRRRRGAGEVQAVLRPKGNPDIPEHWKQWNIYVDGNYRESTGTPGLERAVAFYRKKNKYSVVTAQEVHTNEERKWEPLQLRGKRGNPPAVKVYDRIKEVVAVKGPGHKCDAACRRAGHTYVHRFKTRAGIYGNPDGSLTVR